MLVDLLVVLAASPDGIEENRAFPAAMGFLARHSHRHFDRNGGRTVRRTAQEIARFCRTPAADVGCYPYFGPYIGGGKGLFRRFPFGSALRPEALQQFPATRLSRRR
jgi:hypothetical protein